MEDGELNTTDVQNRRNGDPAENKHARQSENWGRGATGQIARGELHIAGSVSSSRRMDDFFFQAFTHLMSVISRNAKEALHICMENLP